MVNPYISRIHIITCLVSDTLVSLPLAAFLKKKMAEAADPFRFLKESPLGVGSKHQGTDLKPLKRIGTGHVGKEKKTMKIEEAIQQFIEENFQQIDKRSHCLPDQLVHSGVNQPEESL